MASGLSAQFVVPSSYTATVGGFGGLGFYYDETTTQLTDGIRGVDDWTADLGSGVVYEWVGWTDPAPTVTFTFTGNPTIHTVYVGFNRTQGSGIYLPLSLNIGGTIFSFTGTELDDGTRGDLVFSGTWTGNSLQLDFTAGGAFTFVDEVQFSTAVIPEPGTSALGFGIAAALMLLVRRRVARC